jgi:hypothetical protein
LVFGAKTAPGSAGPNSWAGHWARPFRQSEKLDLIGDDFAAVVLDAVFVVSAVVDVADDGELLALLHMLGDGGSQAIEAGDAVPLRNLFGIAIFADDGLAFGALVAACGEAESGEGAALGGGFADPA